MTCVVDQLEVLRDWVVDALPVEELRGAVSDLAWLHDWHDSQEIIEQVIDYAKQTAHKGKNGRLYAKCPLCGQGASGITRVDEGFTVDVELRLHLMGSGNIPRCMVIESAYGLHLSRRPID